MKTNLSLLFWLSAIVCFGQNEVTLLLKVVNQLNAPLGFEPLEVLNQVSNEKELYYTKKNGTINITLLREVSYKFILEDSSKSFQFQPAANSASFTTKKVQVFKKPKVGSHLKDTIIYQKDPIIKNNKANAEVIIKLITQDKKPVVGAAITLSCANTNKVYINSTNKNGTSKFILPRGETADIFVNGENLNQKVIGSTRAKYGTKKVFFYEPLLVKESLKGDTVTQEVEKGANPTPTRALVTINVIDLKGLPLINEPVTLESLNDSKKTYFAMTNKEGQAKFLVPKTSNYELSFKYDPGIDTLVYKLDGGRTRTEVEYSYMGSKRFEERKLERERLLAERDSLFKIYGSSSYNNGFELTKAAIEKKALSERKKAIKDNKYFEKQNMTVCAVLQRHPEWNKKAIVTDITGSMSPYFKEVLLWHAMKLIEDPGAHYTFFNDGDSKPTHEKIIGSTGGIYSSKGDLKSMIKALKEGTSNGYGGDGPENDIEGLINASKEKTPGELILVADNYSSVRDIKLLTKLKVPVRIIVCGSTNSIHEDYLQLAYATGGSIHTLKADYLNLKAKIRNNSINIGGSVYLYNRGKFIKE